MGISQFINLVFTQPIFNGLMLLYHLFTDFGLSIIVLTVIIRLILFPLTLQQLKSTKAMQELQPQIASLRKKYKDDQRGQAMALQALYKEYSVNPLSGCLPLLVQFPVLYGLYFAFRAVIDDSGLKSGQGLVHLNGFIYPFLPKFDGFPNINLNWFTFLNHNWFISLAHPDPTHILPILAGLATFIQLRMSQARNPMLNSAPTDSKDPIAQQQQTMKMMSWFMPLITIFFGWSFPAGLALYWTTGSIFMAVQQYFVSGWGSLLTTPEFMKKDGASRKPAIATSNGSNGNGKVVKGEAKVLQQTDDEEIDIYMNGTGPVERNMRYAGSSTRRRPRSSASARRRGSVPRKNT